ncbi:MAG: ATP-dependent DNA helicase RecG [Clostridia bacterium]
MIDDALNKDIRYMKGVGPKRAGYFNDLGIYCLKDLVEYYPRTYEDRSIVKKINELESGEKATVQCVVTNIEARKFRNNLHIIKAVLSDGTGYMNAVWFNQQYNFNKLGEGKKYWFFGRVERKILMEMINPAFSDDFDNFAVIVPIYSKNKGLTQNTIRNTIKNALSETEDCFTEIMPDWIMTEYGLLEYGKSVRNIHFPKSNDLFYKARERLVFQEFFLLQTALLNIRHRIEGLEAGGSKFIDFCKGDMYIKGLGFQLTGAQQRVINEIRGDLASGRVMRRLVQGDVGSGKTAVAAAAIADACGNGFQAAFMAPTEILARQHYESLRQDFDGLGYNTVYLSGGSKTNERNAVLELIKNGGADIIIGTHALIQKGVEFNRLGLVITDEQHRFGVNQREALAGKGETPHSLVLTATPIPRTLALILYGDLDISVIDEMPPGRQKIETYAVDEGKRRRVLDFAERRMKEGSQVYVVCPRIEDDEASDMMSAESIYEELQERFGGFNVELLHGRMKASEKDSRMQLFYEGVTNMLVSTTVIEVGVNVPNATLMIIENAERFGLAQLHQLRGRVGRGSGQSYCIMVNRSSGEIPRKRMKIMEKSTDGFYISEQDLVLRGPGEFFGTRQHGLPEFRIANIYTDMDILKKAQKAALRIISEDPCLLSIGNANIMKEIEMRFENFKTI